ncbi:MAG: dynamin family protein [Gemmatales bacterium]|nr:dynamin family protein [Gemmatales bacterium]MDW8176109.1 dynamin family protein [Gemmatales bacterium]
MSSSFVKELAQQLSQLSDRVDRWLARKHLWPYEERALQTMRQFTENLRREIVKLAAEEVYGIIVFLGGTGVGKSSLLNALAGEQIAPVSAQRPTTRQVVAYVHEALPVQILPPSILENLVRHNNDALRNKVLVDAPDIDSRETSNYHRLRGILPDADIILYVGSPEKYHDQIGWELFREFSRHKAFAFVLNRWDECWNREKTGKPPDQDWLEDLNREGYDQPLLFRTSARYWMEKRNAELPSGDQFLHLRRWLEAELGEKELLVIRQTNLEGLVKDLKDLAMALADSVNVSPEEVWSAWQNVMERDIREFLIRSQTFLTEQREYLERFLRQEANRRIDGWLAPLLNRLQGGLLSKLLLPAPKSESYTSTYILDLVNDLTKRLREDYLRNYGEDLKIRLLTAANERGIPIVVLEDSLEGVAATDWLRFWKEQAQGGLQNSLETLWQPAGWKGRIRSVAQLLPGRLCWLAGLAGLGVLMYRMFLATAPYSPGLWDVLYFLMPFFLAEALSYALVYTLSPKSWQAVAFTVNERISQLARDNFTRTYKQVLDKVFGQLHDETQQLHQLIASSEQLLQRLKERREEIEEVLRLYRT